MQINLSGVTIEEAARMIWPINPELSDHIDEAYYLIEEAEKRADNAEAAQFEAEEALDDFRRKVQAVSSSFGRMLDDKPKAKELRDEVDRLATLLAELAEG